MAIWQCHRERGGMVNWTSIPLVGGSYMSNYSKSLTSKTGNEKYWSVLVEPQLRLEKALHTSL